METTKVIIEANGQGEVQLFSENRLAGKMEISVEENLLTVYHTEVNPAHEGKGFAKLLLNQLIAYAEEHQLKILPLCPYVHLQFRRHPEQYKAIWYGYED